MENERIVTDANILVGKPIVRGTRLSVDFLLGLLADGWSEAEILRNYPGLTDADLRACLAYPLSHRPDAQSSGNQYQGSTHIRLS